MGISITSLSGGGGGTPSAPDTSIQFNDAGAFGGSAGFTFTKATGTGLTSLIGAGAGSFDGSPALLLLNGATGTQQLVIKHVDDIANAHNTHIQVVADGTLLIIPDEATTGFSLTWNPNAPRWETAGDFFVGGLLVGSNDILFTFFAGTISGRTATGNENGGEVDLVGSGGSGTGDGGPVQIIAGDAAGAGTGGTVFITAGGSGSGTPGDIDLSPGAGFIKLSGPLLAVGNQSLATGVSAGNNFILRAYDVDGATYKTFLTLTSNNTPDLSITPPAGTTVTLQATDFKASDSSSGINTTITTASLVGKTITVKNGLITNFS